MTTLTEYEKRTRIKRCGSCGGKLGSIEHYSHSGGWAVEGFNKRQWLYKPCLECGYDWALWKLGVPRE